MALDPFLQRAMNETRAGRLPESIVAVRRLLVRQPGNLDVIQVLAVLLVRAAQLEQAAHFWARAAELSPGSAAIRNNFANILARLHRYSEAADQLRRAVEIDPTYELAWMGLASTLLHVPDSEGAIAAATRGRELNPGSPDMIHALALALGLAGRTQETLAVAEQGHQAHPQHAKLHSLYLMMLGASDRPSAQVFRAHRRFGELHPSSGPAAATTPDPDKRLRIGWLSADLRTHSVAFFAEGLLEHAPTNVESCVLSTYPSPEDPTSIRLRRHVQEWHEVGHLDDAALDRRIRELEIDILMDLQGHTPGNRLVALAAKPAPLMVTAIAYPDTTGLPAMDYRLADSITDPPGAEAFATERLLRIDPCFLCYRPPDSPEPAMPPGDAPLTFGSFNAPTKIGETTVALWRGVLDAVPGSRLLLKARDLDEECSRARLRERLVRGGISAERVDVLPGAPTIPEHLGMYSRIHIALDTTPYNGTTTTCEALWMGVPAICLEGQRHVSRVGMSLLSAVGRGAWVARSPEQFAQIAAQLAQDRAYLGALRRDLRRAMRGSALCDAPAYAARLYRALRDRWREWCRSARAAPGC